MEALQDLSDVLFWSLLAAKTYWWVEALAAESGLWHLWGLRLSRLAMRWLLPWTFLGLYARRGAVYGMNVNHLVEKYHQLIEEDLRRIENAMGEEFEEAVEEVITGKSSARSKTRVGLEPEKKVRAGDAEGEIGGRERRRREGGAGSTFMENDRERGGGKGRDKPLGYVRGGGYDEDSDVAEGGGGPFYEEEEGGLVTKARSRNDAREEAEDERWGEGDAADPSTPARLKASYLNDGEEMWGGQEVRKGRYAGEEGLPPTGGPRASSAKVKGPIGPEVKKKVGRQEAQPPVEAVFKGEGKAVLTLRDLVGEDEEEEAEKTQGVGRRKGKADKSAQRRKKQAPVTRASASEEESEEEDEPPKGRKTIRRTRRRGMGSKAIVVSAPSAWTSMAAAVSSFGWSMTYVTESNKAGRLGIMSATEVLLALSLPACLTVLHCNAPLMRMHARRNKMSSIPRPSASTALLLLLSSFSAMYVLLGLALASVLCPAALGVVASCLPLLLSSSHLPHTRKLSSSSCGQRPTWSLVKGSLLSALLSVVLPASCRRISITALLGGGVGSEVCRILGMAVGVALVQAAVIMYRDLQAFVASAHLREDGLDKAPLNRLALRARVLVACGACVLLLSGVGPVTCLGSALWGLETARACAQGSKAHALTHALYEMQGIAGPLLSLGSMLIQSPGLLLPSYMESAPPRQQERRQKRQEKKKLPNLPRRPEGAQTPSENGGLDAPLWSAGEREG